MKHSQRFRVKRGKQDYDGAVLIEEENWFGTRVKLYRERLRLSQMKVAEEMEVSLQTVRDWERGDKYPHMHRLLPLARLLGIEVGQLFPSTGYAGEVRESTELPPAKAGVMQRIEEHLSVALSEFRKIRENQNLK